MLFRYESLTKCIKLSDAATMVFVHLESQEQLNQNE